MGCKCERYISVYRLYEYKIVRCKDCGLVKTLGKMNVDYNDYHRDSDYAKYTKHFRNIFQKRIDIIERFKKHGRVLEIGASTGELLSLFAKEGWEVEGVEPSGVAKIAAGRGLKMYKRSFEKAKLKAGYYDVVVLNHTLEHIEDHFSVMRKVNKILKKGGIVYVDVPNFGSLSRMIARDQWKYLLPEEHVWHFERHTLEGVLAEGGFDILWWGSWSGIFDVSNKLEHFRLAWKERKVAFAADIIEVPNNIFSTALKMGTNLAVVGRKK